jgi:hypothetical protein
MVDPGQLSGVYNLVVADEYDLFEHQVPVDEFEEMLRESDVPDELCVVGLAGRFGNDDAVSALSRSLDGHADRLESRQQLPTIQFAVEGSFQRRNRDFELRADGELYRLSRVFGRQIQRRDSGWLTTSF